MSNKVIKLEVDNFLMCEKCHDYFGIAVNIKENGEATIIGFKCLNTNCDEWLELEIEETEDKK